MTGSIGKTTYDPAMPAEREEVDRLYRAAVGGRADEQPSLQLDQRILAAAHAEVARAGVTKRAGPPWWRRYFAPASAVIVALFGLTIAWHVMDEQELAQRQQLASVGGAATDAGSQELPMAAPVPDNQPAVVPAPSTAKAEAIVADEAAAPMSAKESVPAPVAKPVLPPLGRAAQPKAAAPATSMTETRKGRAAGSNASLPPQSAEAVGAPASVAVESQAEERASSETPVARSAAAASTPAPLLRAAPAPRLAEMPDRQNAVESAGVAPAATPLPPLAKKADGERAMPKAEHRADVAVEPFVSPEDGLRQIRAARDAGRRDEAVRLLTRWRAQYPQHTLPDDLVDLLPTIRGSE